MAAVGALEEIRDQFRGSTSATHYYLILALIRVRRELGLEVVS